MKAEAGLDHRGRRQAAEIIRQAFLPEGGEPAAPLAASDWPLVVEAADQNGLTPLLHAALKRAGRAEEPPAEFRERLRKAYLMGGTINWLAYQELGRLLDRLEAQSVPVVLLKGCALAATLYEDTALRPMHDFDLLVPKPAVERLNEVLLNQGYRPQTEMADDFGRSYLQEQMYARGGQSPAQVDAHWHLTSMPYYRARMPIEWFWQHTQPTQIEGRAAQIFDPVAQLLHLSLHFALHHWSDRLIWSYDMALLLSRHHDDLDWGELARSAQTFGLSEAVRSSLANVYEWWGAQPPVGAAARLAAMRPGPAERLLLAVMASRRREARVISDGLSLPGVRAKLGYWLKLVFPSPSYMRQRYHISHGALLPFYYLLRIGQGGFRVARSVVAIGLGALRAAVST